MTTNVKKKKSCKLVYRIDVTFTGDSNGRIEQLVEKCIGRKATSSGFSFLSDSRDLTYRFNQNGKAAMEAFFRMKRLLQKQRHITFSLGVERH